MSLNELPAIPWAHSQGDFGSVWIWDTPHFRVTVNGSEHSCYYVIATKSSQDRTLKPFADGRATTFVEAETMVRGTIGKAYSPSLGYSGYAGALATTFRISNGAEVDFGQYIEQTVTLKVVHLEGEPDSYSGILSVKNYSLMLNDGKKIISIPPAYVKEIILPPRITTKKLPSVLDRMVHGQVVKGCTGRVGELIGTVEHLGSTCPIHEQK